MMQVIDDLVSIVGKEGVLTDERMKKHTTFRVGGPADFYVMPKDKEALRDILLLCKDKGIEYHIIGNGSNLLVGDKGIRGMVINTSSKLNYLQTEGNIITAGAGSLLSKVAKEALHAGLTGMEFAAGIPGTVGGAVVMNAGAYGSDISEVILEATVITPEGEFKTLSNEELELGYRKSCIEKNNYIVVEAKFGLKQGDREQISSYMEELAIRRREKQPLEYPSAGSTFKRPEGYFAGKLIMEAGLAGYRIGGACVSPKHCGFVVNDEGATAADIVKLCSDTAEIVKEKYNVNLEMEVKKLGEF